MSNYLVVAHQTSTSSELLDKLRELAREDPSAGFTLVVPATPVQHLLTWTEGESVAEATRAAEEARRILNEAGVRVQKAVVGDPAPLEAIADALQDNAAFDAIVISTLPPGISRWLKLDVHTRAQKRFDLPVISVVASKTAVGASTKPR